MNKIYIDDVGSGFPLVLVHGYLGSSKMWCNQINYFSKFYRVITPALPGFGESSSAQSLDSINEMAQFIIKILDEKKIQKFNLDKFNNFNKYIKSNYAHKCYYK